MNNVSTILEDKAPFWGLFFQNIFFIIYQSILSKTRNSIEMKMDIHCPFYQFLDFEYTIITIARPQILFTHLEQVLGKTGIIFRFNK